MNGKMHHVSTAAEIDLHTWEWFETEDPTGGLRGMLMAGCATQITEVVRTQFDEDPPELMFPITYSIGNRPNDGHGGEPPEDPVTLYVELPLGPNEQSVCYAVSLEAVVDSMLEYLNDNSEEAHTVLDNVSARLRELADKIDKAKAPDNPTNSLT